MYWHLKCQTLQTFGLNHKDGDLFLEDREQGMQVQQQWEDAVNQQKKKKVLTTKTVMGLKTDKYFPGK